MADLERSRSHDKRLVLLQPMLSHVGMSTNTFDGIVSVIRDELTSHFPDPNAKKKYLKRFETLLDFIAVNTVGLTHASHNPIGSITLALTEPIARVVIGERSSYYLKEALFTQSPDSFTTGICIATARLIPKLDASGKMNFVERIIQKVQYLPEMSGSKAPEFSD